MSHQIEPLGCWVRLSVEQTKPMSLARIPMPMCEPLMRRPGKGGRKNCFDLHIDMWVCKFYPILWLPGALNTCHKNQALDIWFNMWWFCRIYFELACKRFCYMSFGGLLQETNWIFCCQLQHTSSLVKSTVHFRKRFYYMLINNNRRYLDPHPLNDRMIHSAPE